MSDQIDELTFNEYDDGAAETAQYPGRGELTGKLYTALGLAGEAGEYADKIKKVLRDSNGEISSEALGGLVKELGDVSWYLSRCAAELGFSTQDVATMNLMKLKGRKSAGTIGGSGDDR